MSNPTIPDDWTGIPEEVEKIITARTIRTRRVIGDVVTDVTRPFRFIEFAREIGMGITYRRAHSYIRQGIIPDARTRSKITAWCEKNRKHLK